MLRLKLPTDLRWAKLAEENLSELMTDHAYCEQKAATSAITIIVNYPEYTEMVSKLTDIAIEEMEHFKMVHERIIAKGWKLGRERKDEYIGELVKFVPRSSHRIENLIHKLLLSAMIEARSCERFRVLYTYLKDKDIELAEFYHNLEQSEAMHFTTFLNFAKEYGSSYMNVEKKWEDFLNYEAKIIAKYGNTGQIHG